MSQLNYLKQFPNGLVLVAEQMPWLESAALSVHIPNGYLCDPRDGLGLSNFTCEMVQRGCGPWSSREYVETLERLGIDHSGSISAAHTTFTGAMLSDNLAAAIEIFAHLVQRPHLPADQLEDARQVCIQEIRSIEDDFAQRTMQALRLRHYGQPWGRNASGSLEAVERFTLDDIRRFYQSTYHPRGTILAVAGKFDWEELERLVTLQFGDWQNTSAALPDSSEVTTLEPPVRGYGPIVHDTHQTHIGVACDGLPYRDDDFFQLRGAIGVLSDGVSSRLFTEVREKRGLCYTVHAYCHSFLDRGAVLAYAGTTTERAQETLDVMLAEFQRLNEGIRGEELQRVQARIKSALIMQQESSGSRSSAIAGDWYYWGRIRTLDELKAIIDGLSAESINAFLSRKPLVPRTIVTFGAQQLETPFGIS